MSIAMQLLPAEQQALERVPHAQIPPFDMAEYAFAPNLSARQLRNTRSSLRHPVRPPMFDAFWMLVGLEGADEDLGASGLSHVVFGPGIAFGSGSASGG